MGVSSVDPKYRRHLTAGQSKTGVRAELSASAMFCTGKLQSKHYFEVSELSCHYVKLGELKV